MDDESKHLANQALRYILIGRQICGIRFCGFPILLIDTSRLSRDAGVNTVGGEIFLRIETAWRLFSALPARLPASAEEIGQQSIETLASTACSLRDSLIIDAALGETIPHLLITFESGEGLFVNGHHDMFECWELSVGDFGLVAVPGDDVAVWVPNGFPPD